jgi:hypothetical protein
MNSHLVENKGSLLNPGWGIPFYAKETYLWKNQTPVGEDHLAGLFAGITIMPSWQLWGTNAATVFNLVNVVGGTTYDMLPFLETPVCLQDGTVINTYRRGGPPATITCGKWQFVVSLGAPETTYYSEIFNVVPNAELNGAGYSSFTFRHSSGWLDHAYYPSGTFSTFYFKNSGLLARPVMEVEEDFEEDGFGNKMLTYALLREKVGTALLCPDYLLHLLHRIGLHDTINFRTGLTGKTFALTNFEAKDLAKKSDYWNFVEVSGIIVNSTMNAGLCGVPPSPVVVC